jgi:hypothetical protein
MQHPEVGDLSDRQIIGFNPVYANHQPPRVRVANSPIVWGGCLAVAVMSLAASGVLLWTKAEKSQAEIDAEVKVQVQQAIAVERARVEQCLNPQTTQPTNKRRK